jgi:hypothetical protein
MSNGLAIEIGSISMGELCTDKLFCKNEIVIISANYNTL